MAYNDKEDELDLEDEIACRIDEAVKKRASERSLSSSSAWQGDKDYRNLCYFMGIQRSDYFEQDDDDPDWVVHNVLRAYIKIQIASLLQNPWVIRTYPRGSAGVVRSSVIPRIARYEWESNNMYEKRDKMLTDKGVFGYGVMRCGWHYRERASDRALVDIEQTYGLPDGEIIARKNAEGAPELWHKSEGNPDRKLVGASGELMKAAIHDDIFLDNISALNFFFDPMESDVRTLENSRYVVWREYVSRDSLLDDPYIRKDAISKVQEESVPNYLTGGIETQNQGDTKCVVVWNYIGEDPEDPTKQTYSQRIGGNYETILKEEEWEQGFFPFVIDAEAADPTLLYPTPVLEDCISDQDEINDALTDLHNHRKRFDRILFADDDAFDKAGLNSLTQAQDGEIIRIKVKSGDMLQNKFWVMPAVQLQPEVYMSYKDAQERIRTKIGLTEYNLGQRPAGVRTATDSAQITSQSGARRAGSIESDRRTRTKLVRLIINTLRNNADPAASRQYYFLEQGAQKIWDEYILDDLGGDYDVDVEVVSSGDSDFAQVMSLLNALQAYTGAAKNPQTGELLIADTDGQPIVKNVRPFIERLLVITGWGDITETILGPPPVPKAPAQPGMPQEGMPPPGMPGQEQPPQPQGASEMINPGGAGNSQVSPGMMGMLQGALNGNGQTAG